MNPQGLIGLLEEMERRGLELVAEGERLRYRPLGAMPDDLAARVAAHKRELLSMLNPGDGAVFSLPELVILARAGIGPGDMPLIGMAKAAFAGLGSGLTLVSLSSKQRTGTPDDLPPDWREMYEERAAVLEFDGGLRRERAEYLALLDIKRQLAVAGESRS